MAAPKPTGGLALARLRLSGVAFLVVIGLLLALSVAIYNKAFTDVVRVTLQADRAGNQLSAPTDVKLRGLIVGEVRKVESTGEGAELELALDPARTGLIPSNVEARLLPKTLFGEKYVALVTPEQAAPRSIRAGDVITQDRSRTSLETARVLDDLVPLLEALDPEDVSSTLNAVSTALRGRGDALGDNLVRLRDYLTEINPELPTLQEDLRGLADLADTLDEASPDLLAVLDDLSFSSRALVDQSDELRRFLSTTTTFSGSADTLLRQNEQRLITVARESLPGLQLFAQYSPEYGCFLQGLDRYNRVLGTTFGGGQPGLRITLEITRDNGGYVAGDEPAYLDDGAPACRGLPDDPVRPAPDEEFRDGYRDAERAGIPNAGRPSATVSTRGALAPQPLAAMERQVLAGVAAPVLGVPAADVPDLATLMLGPMTRGATVRVTP